MVQIKLRSNVIKIYENRATLLWTKTQDKIPINTPHNSLSSTNTSSATEQKSNPHAVLDALKTYENSVKHKHDNKFLGRDASTEDLTSTGDSDSDRSRGPSMVEDVTTPPVTPDIGASAPPPQPLPRTSPPPPPTHQHPAPAKQKPPQQVSEAPLGRGADSCAHV